MTILMTPQMQSDPNSFAIAMTVIAASAALLVLVTWLTECRSAHR